MRFVLYYPRLSSTVWTLLALLLITMLPTVSQTTSAQTTLPASTFTPSACDFPLPANATVECGVLRVPENRANPDTRLIDLAVAIFRSTSQQPAADPVIFLQGGPGGATIDLAQATYGTFIEPLTQTRDVILFDQRGTGRSVPALNCSELTEASYILLENELSPEATSELYLESVSACRDRLTAEGVELSAYTSAENAADVAALAQTLGYEQVNLYGGSYGVRLALTVIRDYPQLVRSAILDSAIPVEINLYDQQTFKTDFALDRLFAACAADAACAEAYPDLEAQFTTAVEALNAEPLPLTVTNFITGEEYNTLVNGADFISAVFIALQVPQFIPDLPALIAAVNEGDVSGLALPFAVTLLLGDSINFGMFLSVNCHEEVFASSAEQMTAAWAEYPALRGYVEQAAFGSAEALFAVCQAWGAKPFDPREIEAVTSDIPVLALAGELDPATPVVWTAQVAQSFPNSTFYEFPGLTHVVGLAGGCPMQIIGAFLNAPDTAPDGACIAEMPAPSFNIR